MKYTLLALLFCLQILRGDAQVTITINPQTQPTVLVNPDSALVIAKATIKNTATTAKKFKWKRNVLNIASGWKSQICDNRACWSATLDTSIETIDLVPNGTSNLDVYITPNGKSGAATIEVKVTEVGNETNTVTGRYLFSSSATKSKDINKNVSNLRIYPNPTTEYFQLSDDDIIDKVVIYNIIGRQMRAYKVSDNAKYYVNDLPDGLYIIRLQAANGSTVKTIRLSKSRLKA
jgi:hypothetical protein